MDIFKNAIGISLCMILLMGCSKTSQSHSALTNISAEEELDSEVPVNVIDQAMPSLMIIPSDQLLQKEGTLKIVEIDGVNYFKRDYQSFLLNNDESKKIIRYIQDKFSERDFPINDLEVCLKNLVNLETYNEADGVFTDVKTMLLQSANPNYVLELDYSFQYPKSLQNHNKELSFNISLIDPVTEKVLGSTQMKGSGVTFDDAVKSLKDKEFEGIASDLKSEFTRIIKYGRDITVRIVISNNASIMLSDLSSSGETISDFIMDYMDSHTKKGTYSLQRNTDTELYFTNVRISNLSSNGTQTNAFNWGRQFSKELRRSLGLSVKNKSQKLNEVVLVIE